METNPIAAGTGTAQRDDPGGRIRTAVGARSGLVGNPSDLFGDKVISLLFDAFSADVTRYESARVTVVPNARDTTSFPLDRLACTDTVLIAATDKLLAFELADPLAFPRRHVAAVNVCGCRTAPALPASTAVCCSMKRAASSTLRKSSVAPDGAGRRSR